MKKDEDKILSEWKEDHEKGITGTDWRGTAEKVGTGGEGNLSGRSSDRERFFPRQRGDVDD